ncbi:hypothetical protein V0288_04770 [Pannus brasiliensis CCIBt3594]|uniref:AAA domain-containing protein n=1 Tax=Pannus brasiliensis CCIBt3594 TaxID=1427578 RepID=A0AAW9QUY3_9CHRO
MWNFWQKENPSDANPTEFRIIGPRRSGKTTYLSALAYWPNAKSDSPIEKVIHLDDDTAKLVGMAKDILESNAMLRATYLDDDPDNLPSYNISIKMKPTFGGGGQWIHVTCKDFAGELFDKLRKGKTAETELYLEECADALGLLILLDGTFFTEDDQYARGLETLKNQLKWRLKNKKKSLSDYRVAVVFNKAEQSQIWIHRHNIHKFMKLKFKKTYQLIEGWGKEWPCPVNYFFCSAFGMKPGITPDTPPKANVQVISRENGVTSGVIEEARVWRPLGLVAPIYWLHTGIDHPKLRDVEE